MSNVIELRGPGHHAAPGEIDIIAADRTVLDIWVAGVPRPKGSLRFVTARYAKEQNDTSPAWRGEVVRAAIRVFTGETITGPVRLEAEFLFPLPKSARGKWRPATSRALGDLDKLVRNVGDALEDARVIENDALIVKQAVEKRYALGEEVPGARIRVVALE